MRWIIALIVLSIVVFLGFALYGTLWSSGCGCSERFTDFLAVSGMFSDLLPPNHYASEHTETFFRKALSSVVQQEAFAIEDVNVYKNYITSKYIDRQLLRETNQYLLDVINNQLADADRSYPYRMKRSKITEVKTLQRGRSVKFIAVTQHIVHRDSKAYGVSIELTTLHDSIRGSTTIKDFRIHGYIAQDKLGCVAGFRL